MVSPIDLKTMRRFVGTWRCADGFSEVEFTVKLKGGAFVVSGIDGYDREAPEIYDVSWNAKTSALRFSTYWSSTGRFMKYTFTPSIVNRRIEVTYTYTAQELWERA